MGHLKALESEALATVVWDFQDGRWWLLGRTKGSWLAMVNHWLLFLPFLASMDRAVPDTIQREAGWATQMSMLKTVDNSWRKYCSPAAKYTETSSSLEFAVLPYFPFLDFSCQVYCTFLKVTAGRTKVKQCWLQRSNSPGPFVTTDKMELYPHSLSDSWTISSTVVKLQNSPFESDLSWKFSQYI